jgi:uncharacterized protein (TIGR03034 family)
MPVSHTIERGESLSTIAAKYGFRNWRTVYDAPENTTFRTQRPNPNLVQAGDTIVIPDKAAKSTPVTVGQQHRYRLAAKTAMTAEVEFCFLDETDPSRRFDGISVQFDQGTGPGPAKTTNSVGVIQLSEPEIHEGVVRIETIRDLRSASPRNWDRYGGDFNTGHSYVVSLPNNPLQLALPIALVRSTRRPRLNEDGTPARDILHGDYTKQQILDLGTMFELDDWGRDLDTVSAATLFADFRRMATELFSTGKLEDNIQSMINHFEGNTGGDYSNADLTQAVSGHDSTKNFEQNIRDELRTLINRHNGDVMLIALNEMQLRGRPHYSTMGDTLGGLTIAINDTWANDVELIEYQLSSGRYRGKFRLTLYDHFGLDQPDVEKKYGMLGGFRAWFILQHLQRFNYTPFVARVVLDYEFSGTVGS